MLNNTKLVLGPSSNGNPFGSICEILPTNQPTKGCGSPEVINTPFSNTTMNYKSTEVIWHPHWNRENSVDGNITWWCLLATYLWRSTQMMSELKSLTTLHNNCLDADSAGHQKQSTITDISSDSRFKIQWLINVLCSLQHHLNLIQLLCSCFGSWHHQTHFPDSDPSFHLHFWHELTSCYKVWRIIIECIRGSRGAPLSGAESNAVTSA